MSSKRFGYSELTCVACEGVAGVAHTKLPAQLQHAHTHSNGGWLAMAAEGSERPGLRDRGTGPEMECWIPQCLRPFCWSGKESLQIRNMEKPGKAMMRVVLLTRPFCSTQKHPKTSVWNEWAGRCFRAPLPRSLRKPTAGTDWFVSGSQNWKQRQRPHTYARRGTRHE